MIEQVRVETTPEDRRLWVPERNDLLISPVELSAQAGVPVIPAGSL